MNNLSEKQEAEEFLKEQNEKFAATIIEITTAQIKEKLLDLKREALKKQMADIDLAIAAVGDQHRSAQNKAKEAQQQAARMGAGLNIPADMARAVMRQAIDNVKADADLRKKLDADFTVAADEQNNLDITLKALK